MIDEIPSQKTKPFRPGLIAFLLSFTFLLALLLAQFFLKYHKDIFGKDFAAFELEKMLCFSAFSLLPFTLPASVLVMAIVYHRSKFKDSESNIGLAIKQSFKPVIIVSLLGFLWLSFVSPKATLHQFRLLYDMRMTKPGEPLKRSNMNVFSTAPGTQNIFELRKMIDSPEVTGPVVYSMVDRAIRHRIYFSKMIGFPFLIAVCYYIGMFLGILNRNQKYLILILLLVYIAILPGMYFIRFWFDGLSRKEIIAPPLGEIYFLFSMTAITILLYLVAERHLKQTKQVMI